MKSSAPDAAARLSRLLLDVRACELCSPHLPDGARPIVQASTTAKILIAGQAPGRKVHESGIPFDDASGERLRNWMGISRDVFYDSTQIAILPMGFCYPGTGTSGDLPPRPECAPTWRKDLLNEMPGIELTIVIGKYAVKWHLPDHTSATLTETVRHQDQLTHGHILLPHPSPRNNIWLKRNPWFDEEVLPQLRRKIAALLN